MKVRAAQHLTLRNLVKLVGPGFSLGPALLQGLDYSQNSRRPELPHQTLAARCLTHEARGTCVKNFQTVLLHANTSRPR